jgi:hypothetical protein
MSRTFISTFTWATCIAAATLLMGCQTRDQKSSSTTPENDESVSVALTADSELSVEQRGELLTAKEALFTKLSGKLMAAMSQGPAQAIAVCRKEATQIAEDVGNEQGVKIGRIGVRLRNPNNTGPNWAAPLIAAKQDTPVFGTLSNGNAAALLPIKLQGQCLMCHGPKEQIAPVIQDQLAKLYPDDEATGFREGELRGWFWIEKPAG